RHRLNSLDGQGHKISNVGEQIQRDNQNGSKREGERNVSLRVFDFTGSERNVVPRVSREKRIGLRHANADEQSKRSGRRQATANVLQFPSNMPEIAEVQMNRVRIPTQEHAQQD